MIAGIYSEHRALRSSSCFHQFQHQYSPVPNSVEGSLIQVLSHLLEESPWPAPQMHHSHKSPPSMAIIVSGGRNSNTSRMKLTNSKNVWREWPLFIGFPGTVATGTFAQRLCYQSSVSFVL